MLLRLGLRPSVIGTPNPATWSTSGSASASSAAVPLGHAAGDDEAGTVAALPVEGEDRVDALASRVVDERARVDDDQVGHARVVGRLHPVGEQRADQLVGIDLVLGTAERLDVEALRHVDPGYRAAAQVTVERNFAIRCRPAVTGGWCGVSPGPIRHTTSASQLALWKNGTLNRRPTPCVLSNCLLQIARGVI